MTQSVGTPDTIARTERGPSLWQRVRSIDEIGVIVALFLLVLLLSIFTPAFRSPTNLLNVARQASYFGIMAVGMVFVLSMGDVDLSVGSVMALVNVTGAVLLRDGFPIWAMIVLALGVAVLCGIVNGALAIWLRIPMIIVTLGTLSIYRGLALVVSQASPVSQFDKESWFITGFGGRYFGVPASVWVMLATGLVGYILYNRASFGRRVQAIGSNLQAARYSGIRISRTRLLVMTLCSFLAGVAGITFLAFNQAGHPNTGLGVELLVIASAIIGGTALSGGSGSIIGALLGALIIAVIQNGLIMVGLSAYWATAATGVVIILAVAIDYFVKRR
jgi:ribose transport system permease protein